MRDRCMAVAVLWPTIEAAHDAEYEAAYEAEIL